MSGTNGTVMCNSLAGRWLGAVCVLDDHRGMVAERIFHAWVAWARRGYENSWRIPQSGKPIGRYWSPPFLTSVRFCACVCIDVLVWSSVCNSWDGV